MNTTQEINKQIKDLQARAEKLEALKAQSTETNAKLTKLYKTSGYDNPVTLIEDLMKRFDVTYLQLKPVSNRKPARRVDVAFRDQIKKDLEGGASKRSLSLGNNVSYMVIQNIERGKYDHLTTAKTSK